MSERSERDPVRIADLLPRFIRGVGLRSRMDLARLAAEWSDAVGEQVGAHSEPVSLERGVLTVRADSGAWAAELKLLHEQIAAAAARFLGDVRIDEVRVQVGSVQRRGTP